MKCKECQKKITFDHYLGTTGSGSNGGNIQLVFKCDCGFYMVPFDLVQISKGRGIDFIGEDETLEDRDDGELGWEKALTGRPKNL